MITREDYLNALELIDLYHRQLNISDIRNSSLQNKTEIGLWFAGLSKKPSGRLCNLLLNNYRYVENGKPFAYVEDVNEFDFMRLNQAGKLTWSEFTELRELDDKNIIL